MLQGALVDKADYSNYAKTVASYGFVVVVPNNERTLTAPNGETVTGLFSEQGQVNEVLDQMKCDRISSAIEARLITSTTQVTTSIRM